MESHNQHEFGDRSTTNRGWQFSLLGLFVVTTVISVCLAFGVSFPRIAIVALIVGLVQSAVLYMADWLIRSRGGRTVKQLTTIAWALLGAALLVVAVAVAGATNVPPQNGSPLARVLVVLIGSLGLLCFVVARRRWP